MSHIATSLLHISFFFLSKSCSPINLIWASTEWLMNLQQNLIRLDVWPVTLTTKIWEMFCPSCDNHSAILTTHNYINCRLLLASNNVYFFPCCLWPHQDRPAENHCFRASLTDKSSMWCFCTQEWCDHNAISHDTRCGLILFEEESEGERHSSG